MAGSPEKIYEGGRIEGSEFLAARWDLMRPDKYMWASVQTIRGCPKHCSFCSVWRTDGQKPRQRTADAVLQQVTGHEIEHERTESDPGRRYIHDAGLPRRKGEAWSLAPRQAFAASSRPALYLGVSAIPLNRLHLSAVIFR